MNWRRLFGLDKCSKEEQMAVDAAWIAAGALEAFQKLRQAEDALARSEMRGEQLAGMLYCVVRDLHGGGVKFEGVEGTTTVVCKGDGRLEVVEEPRVVQ